LVKGVGLAVSAALVILWASWLPAGAEPSSSQAPSTEHVTGVFPTRSSGSRHETGLPVHVAQAVGPSAKATSGSGRSKQPTESASPVEAETVRVPEFREFSLLARDPLDRLDLENIKPLYSSPAIQGEGIWQSADTPRDSLGRPIIYTTVYRPSPDFPNAIVYMMIVDMSKTLMQYYVGSQEPAARVAISEVEPNMRSRLIAITNAMWMQRHSKGAGAIFRGKVVYPMVDGMATLIVYADGSVDIQEWGPDIPANLVRDARQLRHLIVKNGMIVRSVLRKGRMEDAEIGLGFLLGGGGRNYEGEHFWYVAHRSAFGIRKDGNLVFVIGHHIGTKELSKALVLAGCERGIHADANPHNIVGNLYLRDASGNPVRTIGLSSEQSRYTLSRYDDGYSKDFFAFFVKKETGRAGRALTKEETATRSR